MIRAGKISVQQLFYILFVSRLFSLLFSHGSLLNIVVKALLSVLLAAVAYLLCAKVPEVGKRLRYPLCVAAVLITVSGAIEYVAFLSEETYPDVPHWVVIVLFALAVIYAARLGTQPLARFSAFCMALLVIAVLLVVCSNLKGVHLYNLKAPEMRMQLEWYEWIALLDVPVLYIILYEQTAKRNLKPLGWAVAGANLTAIGVYAICIAVMGTAIRRYDYPVFHLFQLAGIGSFTRLDIFLTGNELIGLFLQSALLMGFVLTVIKERRKNEKD